MAIPFTAAGSDKATLADCIDVSNATMAEEDKDADQIWVWNPATSGYVFYYLYTDGIWYNTKTWDPFATDYPNGLPAGNFFWYSSKDDGNSQTITFKSPL